jgi:hypothetical protein
MRLYKLVFILLGVHTTRKGAVGRTLRLTLVARMVGRMRLHVKVRIRQSWARMFRLKHLAWMRVLGTKGRDDGRG